MLAKKITVILGLSFLAGCHCGSGSAYRGAEYGMPPEDVMMAPGMAPAEKSFVDRHPLLHAPRNYYRDSSDNFVVKVLAGTFVGVPVGVAREIWQIGYGQ